MKLARKLPRQPGRKESRYAHLLSGIPEEPVIADTSRPEAATMVDRKGELQEQIDELRRTIESLKDEFASFKAQFE
jgi:hypothetical protein